MATSRPDDNPDPVRRDRRTIAVAAALAFALVAAVISRRPTPTLPGDPTFDPAAVARTAAARAGSTEAADLPPRQRWPSLQAGVELLERNRHAEAEQFFRERQERTGLSPAESGMALYFQAEALFALDKLDQSAVLYKRFLERFSDMPPADNARSALEYIAKAPEYRKALGQRVQ